MHAAGRTLPYKLQRGALRALGCYVSGYLGENHENDGGFDSLWISLCCARALVQRGMCVAG